jgi:protein phosphatase
MQLRITGAVRAFALYGDTTGETDEHGLPVRRDWAADYRGEAVVVYGHTPAREAVWVNETICIDTGCVFGGALTALRWPERELVSEPAAETYFVTEKPIT